MKDEEKKRTTQKKIEEICVGWPTSFRPKSDFSLIWIMTFASLFHENIYMNSKREMKRKKKLKIIVIDIYKKLTFDWISWKSCILKC